MASLARSAKLEADKARQQHIFDSERVQAFSDAVFAIVATFAVVPLKLSKERVLEKGGYANFRVEKFFLDQWPKYLVYAYSFALVLDVWICHVSIFGLAEQVNDTVLWLNLACLLLVTFLPFSTGLVSSFPGGSSDIEGEQRAVAIAAGDILAIGITLIVLAFYIFRRQALVHPDIGNNPHIRSLKRMSFVFLIFSPIFALLALAFSFLTTAPEVCFVLFYLVIFVSGISKITFYLIMKFRGVVEKTNMAVTFRMNKFRMEAFSDGVYSIAATLIVLDLTSESIPSRETVLEQHGGNLMDALHESRHVFLAYFTSFVIIGLLWFVQYGMFHFVKKMTNSLSFINLLSLFLVGLIPFVSGVNSIFSQDVHDNSVIGPNKTDSLRGVCFIVFLVGISQMLFWVVAQFQKSTCLTEEVDFCYSGLLQFIKTLVFPITSMIIFWGTFSETFIENHVYNYFLFAAPFVLIALKSFFIWYARFKGVLRGGVASLKKRGSTSQRDSVKEDSPLINEKEAVAAASESGHAQQQSYSIEMKQSPEPSPIRVQISPGDMKGQQTVDVIKKTES